jgi:hypothetical protein
MCVAAYRAIFRGENPKNEFRPAQNISIIVLDYVDFLKVI